MEPNNKNSPASSIVIENPIHSDIDDDDDDISSSISTSDSDGFVSGGEDFDTASERPVVPEEEDGVDDVAMGLPVVVKRPVAVVTEDDDEDDDVEPIGVRVLGSDDVAGLKEVEPVIVTGVADLGGDDVAGSGDVDPVVASGVSEVRVSGIDDVAGSGDVDAVVASGVRDLGIDDVAGSGDVGAVVASGVRDLGIDDVAGSGDVDAVVASGVRDLGSDDVAGNGIGPVSEPGVIGEEISEVRVLGDVAENGGVVGDGDSGIKVLESGDGDSGIKVLELGDGDSGIKVLELGGGDSGIKVLSGGEVAENGVSSEGLDLGSGVVEDESVEVFTDCDCEVAKSGTNEIESLESEVDNEIVGEAENGTQAVETAVGDGTDADVAEPEAVVIKEIEVDEKPEVEDSETDNGIVAKHVVDEAGTVEAPETVKAESFDEKPEVEALESEDSNVAKGFGDETKHVDIVEKEETESVNGSSRASPVVDKVDDDVAEEGVDVVDTVDADVAVKEAELVYGSSQVSPDVEKADNSGDDEEKFEELINAINQTTNNPEEVENNEASTEQINNVAVSDRFDDSLGEEFDAGSDEETDGMVFGSSQAAKQFMEELEREVGSGSRFVADGPNEVDGQIASDSEEEGETDGEGGEEREVFDSAAFAALLKAATGGGGGGSDGGNITITSQDGSRLFSIERPAGLGSVRSTQPMGLGMGRANRTALFAPASVETEKELSDEEKKKLDSLQKLRVKFLRLVRRLGASPEDSVAAQVLYRLAMVAGRPNNRAFSLEEAKTTALELEAEGKDDLDFSINILVLGKCGVGKSSTINSIFGKEKSKIGSFEPGTTSVREIVGAVDGVKIKVIDTPGLKPAVMEQGFNRKVLSSVKRFTKKSPPDIILYVDRLDSQTRDLNDLPMLKTITGALGSAMWRNAIVALTHGASAPPEGPNGNPLNYEVSVTQRSHVVQQSIGHAVGDLRIASPNLMNPVSLVENHPLCRKNREGQKVLPNGHTWRPQLLLLCYSMKILAEANLISKPQDPFDHRKLFGFRVRSPPLPYLLSSMLQTRAHPKLASDQGIDNGDSDADVADFSDSDNEDEEDEYDQLPPFKPLKKAQVDKLSKEQRKAYFEEFDYRVKLLQKKQWKEEVKRVKEMKRREKGAAPREYDEAAYEEPEGAAPVATPLPDMTLPPSFDSDNPAYRYRFLEPTSQFLARPVLDTHGWDHDCGYDGVNLEQSLALASKYPASVTVQVTKDKKDFSIHLDSSIAAKHGDDGSTMAGFDIQNVGKQLAYIVRGETKFKNFKRNKTAAGVSVTFLGENVATGLKIEDQIAFNKQWAMVGSAGTVRCQGDAAYGANFEIQRREVDYPIGQVQSTYGLSLIKWRGDWALGFNSVAQFAIGRNSKVAVRAGINNKLSGQITARTSSSDHLSLVLVGVIPIASAIYKKIWPAAADNYFGY